MCALNGLPVLVKNVTCGFWFIVTATWSGCENKGVKLFFYFFHRLNKTTNCFKQFLEFTGESGPGLMSVLSVWIKHRNKTYRSVHVVRVLSGSLNFFFWMLVLVFIRMRIWTPSYKPHVGLWHVQVENELEVTMLYFLWMDHLDRNKTWWQRNRQFRQMWTYSIKFDNMYPSLRHTTFINTAWKHFTASDFP